MEDEITISAMRDISPGEELTIDYAMFEIKKDRIQIEICACLSPNCRKVITGNDWRLPELQERYRAHFTPIINRKIASAKPGNNYARLSCYDLVILSCNTRLHFRSSITNSNQLLLHLIQLFSRSCISLSRALPMK